MYISEIWQASFWHTARPCLKFIEAFLCYSFHVSVAKVLNIWTDSGVTFWMNANFICLGYGLWNIVGIGVWLLLSGRLCRVSGGMMSLNWWRLCRYLSGVACPGERKGSPEYWDLGFCLGDFGSIYQRGWAFIKSIMGQQGPFKNWRSTFDEVCQYPLTIVVIEIYTRGWRWIRPVGLCHRRKLSILIGLALKLISLRSHSLLGLKRLNEDV